MSPRITRWIAVVGGLALCGAVALFLSSRKSPPSPVPSGESDDDATRWRGFSAGQASLPSSAEGDAGADGGSTVAGDPPPAQQTEAIMGSWRHAILTKDADTVMTLDRIFAAERERFMPPLTSSAETDSEERVRAFSTRVLGKMQAPSLAALFMRLLKDSSQHVRGNAAWALGELANQPDGRQPARAALTTLRRIEKHDGSAEARDAAAIAVRKLR